MTREDIRNNRENIMNNYEHGQSYDIKGDGFEIKISPIGKKEEGKTYINFLSCEDILREKYNLNEENILTVFQTEVNITNEKYLTNKVEYAVYDENNQLHDLAIIDESGEDYLYSPGDFDVLK